MRAFLSFATEDKNFGQVPIPSPSGTEVLVRIRRSDVYGDATSQKSSAYLSRIVVVGTVKSVGNEIKDLETGDRVLAWTRRVYGECALASRARVYRIPDLVSFDAAAAAALAYFTAYHALVHKAALQAGQTVLVHGKCSPLTTACVEVARLLGARLVAVATDQAGFSLVNQYVRLHSAQHSCCEPAVQYDVVLQVSPDADSLALDAVTPSGVVVFTSPCETHHFTAVAHKHYRLSYVILPSVSDEQVADAADFIMTAWRSGKIRR